MNFRKVSSIFRDSCQLSIYDEDRSVTIGLDDGGVLRVVIHTFEQVDKFNCNIRIISARKATNQKKEQYQTRIL
ncbi:MAG: BrnT family toxin [Geminocystis sp. GBBB08]|nr:BrnT family toxin [Geminocystis sp. GBBB08]